MKASGCRNRNPSPVTYRQRREVGYTRAVSGPSKRPLKNSVKRSVKRTATSRKNSRSAPRQTNQQPPNQQTKQTANLTYEAEVLPGLEPFTLTELKGLKGVQQVKQAEGGRRVSLPR